jgi:O-6-methylguanine DNA methyltransferase
MSDYDAVLEFAPCALGAVFTGDALTRLDFLPPTQPDPQTRRARAPPGQRARLLPARSGARIRFELRTARHAVPASRLACLAAHSGGRCAYLRPLARELDTAPRALGQACGANPLPIVIPCHRVVAASGLGGFMHAADGAALDIKRWLLTHERALAQTAA